MTTVDRMLNMQGLSSDSTCARVALTFHYQLLPCCIQLTRDDRCDCQSESLSDCGMLQSAEETLHLDEHGQMPLAFLVLHASLNRYLDCPRRHARRYPCWFTSCLLANPSQDSRAVLTRSVTPFQVECWLRRFVHYVTPLCCP